MSKLSFLSCRLVLNEPSVKKRFSLRAQNAQRLMSAEILADCTPYVPYRTGATCKSGKADEKGVSWSTDYARKIYYSQMKFNTAIHPLATSQWVEKAKAVNLSKWVKNANKNMK